MTILLKNISYLDVENEVIKENFDIFIKDNIIEKIDKNIDIKADQIIDGTDKLAIPGLVNAHTHLGMSMFKNYADDMDLMDWLENKIWPLEEKLTDTDIYYSALLSLVEMIKSGTTLCCDMYFSLKKNAKAIEEAGIRGVISRGLTDVDNKGEEKLQKLAELIQSKAKYSDRVKFIPGPHAIYTCSGDYLKKVREFSEKYDTIINIHLSETETEVKNSLEIYSKTPINYVCDLGYDKSHIVAAHCTHITDEEIERVKDKKFYPIYNPSSNLKLASGFTPIKKLLDAGITVGIGTDGSSSNNNQNMLEEMHIASIVNKAVESDPKVVKAIDVIKMATINGAKALGYDNLGYIRENFLADIAIFDLNSNNFTPRNNLINAICYSASSEDIVHLICNGELIMKDRTILTLDEEKIRFMVMTLWEDLKKR